MAKKNRARMMKAGELYDSGKKHQNRLRVVA